MSKTGSVSGCLSIMTSYDMSYNAILAQSTSAVNCLCQSGECPRAGAGFVPERPESGFRAARARRPKGSAIHHDLLPPVGNDLVGLVCWIDSGAVIFSNKDNAEGAALEHSGELPL